MKKCILIVVLACVISQLQAAENTWHPGTKCELQDAQVQGIGKEAVKALERLKVDHRVTQTLNTSVARNNYHGEDYKIEGNSITAAVDISVRCLTKDTIQVLLSSLADEGFAAWYREDGSDDWQGPSHIHAVWAEEPLKQQLRLQIKSWLNGKTGLVGDRTYTFWQPNEAQKASITSKLCNSTCSPPNWLECPKPHDHKLTKSSSVNFD